MDLAKEHQTFIAETTQKAVSEFAPHQKAIGLMMPKIAQANKGAKVDFTPEEITVLKNASIAAQKFEAISGLFSPKHKSDLAAQINNAKSIQVVVSKYAMADNEKMAKKIADGTFIEQHQGGTQSVIGWNKLGDNEKPTIYTKARKLLEANPEFLCLMQEFANVDDKNSENFGATENGIYSKVVIEFEVLSGKEMANRFAEGLNGIVLTEAYINKAWKEIRSCSEAEFFAMTDIFKQIRIIVFLSDQPEEEVIPPSKINSLHILVGPDKNKLAPYSQSANRGQKRGDPLPSGAKETIQPIRTLTHEIFAHARGAAARVNKFQIAFTNSLKEKDIKKQQNKKITAFKALCAAISEATNQNGVNDNGMTENDQPVEITKYSKEHEAISGIDSLTGERVPYNTEYENVNDATQELLKNDSQKVVRYHMKSPIPLSDENAVPLPISKYKEKSENVDKEMQGENTVVEIIPIQEAFIFERLKERSEYANMKDREKVQKNVEQEYLSIKAKDAKEKTINTKK